MSVKKEFLLNLLSETPDTGSMIDHHETHSVEFIVLFDNDPANYSQQVSMTKIAESIVETGCIEILGTEAGSGDIDTSWLKRIDDPRVRNQIVDNLFKSLKLAPAEYIHIRASVSFILFGAEDMDLYKKAHEAFMGYTQYRVQNTDSQNGILRINTANDTPEVRAFHEFEKLLEMRANKIVENLLNRMKQDDLVIAGLICTTPLVDSIVPVLQKRSLSYARFKPQITAEWDQETYEKQIAEQDKKMNAKD